MMNQTEFLVAFNSAAGAYQANTGGGSLAPWGYTHVKTWEDPATGFKARAYVDSFGNYILAFAGTEDFQDAYQDLANFGLAQWDDNGPAILQDFRRFMVDVAPVNSIQFTGHSLGGALAQYAAYDFVSVVDGSAIISANNVSLTTFNALGGELGLQEKFKDKYNANILNGANIHHYYDPSDLVSRLSPHLGGQSTNYQLRTSTDPIFTFDAHVMSNIQTYIADGTIRTDLQARHDYFEIDKLAEALQIWGENMEGWTENNHQVSDAEAAARILSMVSIIPYVSESDAWGELKAFLIDNIVRTSLAPKFGITSEIGIVSLKFAMDSAIQAVGKTIAKSPGAQVFLQGGTQLTIFIAEAYEFLSGGPELDPAEKALTYSLLNYIAGSTLSVDENGHFDERVNENVALKIFQMAHIDDRSAFPTLLKDIGTLLGQNIGANFEDAITLVNRIVEDGIVLADFMVSADSYTPERLLNLVREEAVIPSIPVDALDARLVRYAIINRLPFILENVRTEYIDPSILSEQRYGLTEESDQYWAHRIEFFHQTLRQNNAGHIVIFDESEFKYFRDYEGGELLVGKNTFGQGGSNTLQVSDVSNIRFGSESNDTNIVGYDQGDYLYGRGGDDSLNGKGGRDHLEGNTGNDTLHGGTENDYLYGGKGDDHLHGEEGNDFLYGGDGADTYYYVNDETQFGGHDTIDDLDAGDRLYINGHLISSVTQLAENSNAYEDAYGNTYLLDSECLLITLPNSTFESGTIRIANFNTSTNNLGIRIDAAEETVPPVQTGHALVVDDSIGYQYSSREDLPTQHIYNRQNLNFDAAQAYDHYDGSEYPILFQGGDGADRLIGGGISDYLYGLSGDDYIEGKGSREGYSDLLFGGLGNDYIQGSEHGDAMWGNERRVWQYDDHSIILYSRHLYSALEESGTYIPEINGISDYLNGAGGDDKIGGGEGNDIILGGSGEDFIVAGHGNDVVMGGTENDTIFGEGFLQYREWDEANQGYRRYFINFIQASDITSGYTYNDTLDGGQGNDEIYGDVGNDVIGGGEGNDRLHGDRYSATENAGEGINLDFTPIGGQYHGNDSVSGGSGNDIIWGGGANDALQGGTGDDEIWGDDDQSLDGQYHGKDMLSGDEGEDVLIGGGQDDILHGGSEDDVLFGDSALQLDETIVDVAETFHGNDELYGGTGNDRLYGGGRDDQLYGEQGDDKLWGDLSNIDPAFHGNDYLSGGSGKDQLVGGGGNDSLDGGEDNDVLFGDGSPDELATSFHGDDVLNGGKGDDQIAGDGGNDTLYGGEGNDLLLGDNETLATSDHGNDILVGGTGADYMDGGAGDDRYIFNRGDSYASAQGNRDTISDNSGQNNIEINGVSLSDISISKDEDTSNILVSYSENDRFWIINGYNNAVDAFKIGGALYSFKELFLETSNSPVVLNNDTHGAFLLGGRQNDSIISSVRDTEFHAGQGDDTLVSQGFGNTFNYRAGDGKDTLYALGTDASPGSNTLDFNNTLSSTDVSLSLDNGQLFLDFGNGNGMKVVTGSVVAGVQNTDDVSSLFTPSFDLNQVENFSGITTFKFSDGEFTYQELIAQGFDIQASEGASSLTGTNTNDKIRGNDSNNTLFGGDGDDEIVGGLGNDTLYGGAGNDTLIDDDGTDLLYGEDGDDHLHAGLGHCKLHGGTGTDHFYISQQAENVDIYDDQYEIYFEGETADLSNIEIINDSNKHIVIVGSAGQQIKLVDYLEVTSKAELADIVLHTEHNDSPFTLTGADILHRFLNGTEDSDEINGLELENTIYGHDGDDYLNGGQLNDSLYGGMGKDTLIGRDGDDLLFGEGGKDILRGDSGHDVLLGGEGDDTLVGGDGDDVLDGGAHDDALFGNGGSDVYLFGFGDGHDTIVDYGDFNGELGTLRFKEGVKQEHISLELDHINFKYSLVFILTHPTDPSLNSSIKILNDRSDIAYRIDRVELSDQSLIWDADDLVTLLYEQTHDSDDAIGHGGVDIINSLNGDDTIRGFAGDDHLTGGFGEDRLYGGEGDDQLYGSEGNDQLYGGFGHDTLEGGDGNDLLYGYDAQNTNEKSNDILHGGAGDDKLYGGRGEDVLNAGPGNDTIYGGADSDTYYYSLGDGDDVIDDESGDADKLVLGAGIAKEDIALFRHQNSLFIVYLPTNEQIKVNAHYIGKPIEAIEFSSGDIWTQTDIDEFVTDLTGEVDHFEGTAGDDTYYIDHYHDTISENSNSGNDTVVANRSYILGDNLENLTLIGLLNSAANGNELDNILIGNAGDNFIDGGQSSYPYHDYDIAYGGAGDDYYRQVDEVFEFEDEGIDTLEAHSYSNPVLPENVENLIVKSTYNYNQVWTGNSLDNYIALYDRNNDTVLGGGGNDTLVADLVRWNTYANLYGESGDDKLYASNSSGHILNGGTGDDTYYLQAGTGATITDTSGFDVIHYAFNVKRSDIQINYDGADILLERTAGGSTNVIRIENGFDQQVIDEVRFEDGAVLKWEDLTANTAPTLIQGLQDVTIEEDSMLSILVPEDTFSDLDGNRISYSATLANGAPLPDWLSFQNFALSGIPRNSDVGSYTIRITASDGRDSSYTDFSLDVLDVSEPALNEIHGDDDPNTIMGTTSNDAIFSHIGNDYVYGGYGNDELYGGDGGDRLFGEAEDDRLFGENGDDRLEGGEGNDLLDGGAGQDYLYGGDGDDILRGGSGEGDDLGGGNGSDTYVYGLGDGTTYIRNYDTDMQSIDKLRFIDNIAPESIYVFKDAYENLIFRIAGTMGDIIVLDHFSYSYYDFYNRLELVEFDNGVVWDMNDAILLSRLLTNSNRAPTVIETIDDQIVSIDDSFELTLSSTLFQDIDGDALTYTATLVNGDALPSWLSFDSSGFSGTPATVFSNVQVKVTATDGIAAVSTGFSISTASSETAPISADDVGITSEDVAVTIDVLSNDYDPDGDALTVISATALNGSVIINPEGTLHYTPIANFNGTDTITYDVSDGQGGTAAASVSVTVNPDNDSPVVIADTAIAQEDNSVIIDVLLNDSDIEGDSLTVSSASALNGSVTINQDGTLNYAPNANFHGTDSISYVVSDGQGGTTTGSVVVTVNPENDDPVAVNDSSTTDEDMTVVIDVLMNDSDIEEDTLSITSASAQNGSVLINDNQTLSYTPNASFTGTDTLVYQIADGLGGHASATVTIQVNPVNVTPSVTLTGTGGHDTLTAGAGDDTLIGLGGNDVMDGGAGNDRFLIEGFGNHLDTVQGGSGFDQILGGAGDDEMGFTRFNSSDSIEEIDGGAGRNVIRGNYQHQVYDFSATTLLNIDAIYGEGGYDIMIGSAGHDMFYGGTGNDVIDGGAGDDVLYGESGHDSLTGSQGSDILVGGSGNDYMDGQEGDDTFLIEGSLNHWDTILGGTGFDQILGGSGDDVMGLQSFDASNSIELIDGLEGTNIILGDYQAQHYDFSAITLININGIYAEGGYDTLIGSAGHDTFFGGSGNDVLIGGEGNDVLYGEDGHDQMTGSAGDDILVGGTGNDVMDGQDGNDTFIIEGLSSYQDTIQGGSGFDQILGGTGDDQMGFTRFDSATGIELIDGGTGINTIRGNYLNQTYDFSATTLVNIDAIYGEAGNDTLIGSQGNDFLYGGSGSDTLEGGDGDDVLIGGSGNDLYKAGIGKDIVRSQKSSLSETDTLEILGNHSVEDLWFNQAGDDLEIHILGNDAGITIQNWYATDFDKVDILKSNDLQMNKYAVDSLVSAMASFGPPAEGNVDLTFAEREQVNQVIAVAWN